YATYPNGGVLKATDGGVTGNNSFADVTPPYGANDFVLFYSPLLMDPADAKTLYAGSSTLFRTIDSAATWSSVKTFPNQAVSAIGVGHDGAQTTLWVGTGSGQLQ